MNQLIKAIRAEFIRLMKKKTTYILMLCHIISIAICYVPYLQRQLRIFMNDGFDVIASGTNEYIYRPFAIGSLTGSILWGIYVLASADKEKKNNSREMVSAFMDERKHSFTRIMAFLSVTILDTVLCMLVFLPVCMKKMDYLFQWKTYIIYPLILMLFGIAMTVSLMEGLYRIFENTIVSLLVFGILTAVQFTPAFINSVFVRWNLPQELPVSDTVGSAGILRILIYTRIILLLCSICIWSLAALFIRKYQYGPARSFLVSLKKPLRLTVPVLCALIAAFMVAGQPFIDHGPLVVEDIGNVFETSWDLAAECSKVQRDYYFDTLKGTIRGTYKLTIDELAKQDLEIYHNAGIKIKHLTFNGEEVGFTTHFRKEDALRTSQSEVYSAFRLPEGSTGELVCEFEGYPTQSRTYYKDWKYSCASRTVGPDYIYLHADIVGMEGVGNAPYTSKTRIHVPSSHIPLADGFEMKKAEDEGGGIACWETYNDYAIIMSSPNEICDIDYEKAKVKLAYNQKNGYAIRKYKLDEAASDVLRYCDDHIGTLNMDETNRITIELVSSELGGGYAADGNAVIDESVLSAENLSDQKDGANGNETFMHEIVHLFLGDLGLPFDDDGLWSCEGMTVYTTYRIVKEKYGALYAKKYYSDVWEEVVKKQNNNFYLRNPGYLDKLPESYRNSILSSIGTDNRYCRMPLMLLKAEQILGEEKMDAVIQELYARRNEYYMNGGCCTFEDFLNAAGLEKEDLEL